MKTSFLTKEEINTIGFKSIGENALISRYASFYSAEHIELGDNVRIDDFCILSGKIVVGSFVHIAAYVALYGKEGIYIDDYSGISAKTIIYSAMDDFSGDYLIGPLLPKEKVNIKGGPVKMERFTQIGAACVVMPNLIIHEGAVAGAMSFINKSMEAWSIYAGIPAQKIKNRKKDCLSLL